MYRDLTENKPPLGYWLYTLAVAVGGYNELAIRLMPIPFVLATIALVWWIALRLGGPVSACLAAALFVLLSTDPYLFGNGANLEHFINFFAVASLALLIRGWDRADRWSLVGLGCLPGGRRAGQAGRHCRRRSCSSRRSCGAAWTREDGRGRRIARMRSIDCHVRFGLGVVSILAVAAAILIGSRGGSSGL